MSTRDSPALSYCLYGWFPTMPAILFVDLPHQHPLIYWHLCLKWALRVCADWTLIHLHLPFLLSLHFHGGHYRWLQVVHLTAQYCVLSRWQDSHRLEQGPFCFLGMAWRMIGILWGFLYRSITRLWLWFRIKCARNCQDLCELNLFCQTFVRVREDM